MALRVLLADESTTIKKVMQLALQDFAVEVKSVQSGIDVLEVAKSFAPDIIFADVLLQKKNGYEVCAELKNNPDVNSVPVVLMWSSFMDLDERQAQACNADRRLEKPFDVENLRQIVLELVPKTRSQRLAHFLQFPESVTEPLQAEEAEKRSSPPTPASTAGDADRTVVVPRTPTTVPRTPAAPKTAVPIAPAPPQPAVPRAPAPPKAPPSKVTVPSPPPVGETEAPSWNMNSFEDINEFALENEEKAEEAEQRPFVVIPKQAPPSMPPADEETFDFQSGDDDFQEVRISPKHTPPTFEVEEEDVSSQPTMVAGSPRASAEEAEEPWSHQNLARFKLDLDPEQEDAPRLRLEVEEIPDSLEHGEFLHHEPAAAPALEFKDIQESAYELPDEGEETLPIPEPGGEKIPAMSSEQLERVIRAQSKDIIESVVRRMVKEIVPDLASSLIREELNRLLEDTSKERSP